ncbi:J domain-containing protein [Chondromyces apiculatus]|uniref:J domain-containing protein n=1 Tax=Chondromyces apiculatus DSM 436 TaxID=1192034 RepID=A0A017T2M1_9BACT|nr:J domain-containing protein [Chondromyces apiculatus]EYF03055.1 Hypothetical protein CAP_6318 [Chondromyces apiculatus DSM 436]
MAQGAVNVISQNVGENVRREQARDLAAAVVQAIFRLVKATTLHAADNQAVVRQVEETVSVVHDFGHRTGYNVSILFTRGSVFVSGQLLKANRSTYEGALELAEILERCGYSEIGVARDVRAPDLITFATAAAESLRSGRSLPERPAPHIRLRAVGDAVLRRETAVDRVDDETEAIVRTYATAIVVMRRFFDDLMKGRYALRQSVKRIAQRLVDLSAGETPAFLGVTALRNQNHDAAGRAVNTAILSLAMTRQITSDINQLGRVGMAALLFDTARPRLSGAAGPNGQEIVPELSDQQEADVPSGTAVVLTALGLVNEPTVMRTVIAYEGHWARRQGTLGPLYRGLRQPMLQARIVATARAFNDLLTPAPGDEPPSADEAIARLGEGMSDPADRAVLRLLVGALGIFPTGTLVELSSGEVALVVQTPSHPARYSQPRVRLVLDAAGGAIQRTIEIDLAERPRPGLPSRYIRRVVATSDDPAAAAMRAHAAVHEPSPASVRARQTTAPPPRPPSMAPGIPQDPTVVRSPRGSTGAAPAMPGRSESPTVRPGRRVSAPQQQPPIAIPPLPRLAEPFGPAVSFTTGRERHAPEIHEAPAAPPLPSAISLEEVDVHGQITRSSWDEAAEEPVLEEFLLEEEGEAPADHAGLLSLPDLQPTAEGALTRTPLVHLLVYMLDRRLTGTTCFVDPDEFVHGIYFVDGVPSKVWTGTMVAPLDRVILDLGLLDEKTLRDSLKEISRKRVLHGVHLVQKGLLDRDSLLTVLRHQLVRKLIALFDLPPETQYAYYDGVNLLEAYGGPELLECEPLAVVMAGVRLHADDPVVDTTLERIAQRPLGLHVEAEVKRFQLHRDEAAVVDLLRTRRMTLDELTGAGVAQERVVRLTVYALAITRHLELGMPGRGPVGVGRDRPASPLIEVAPSGKEAARGARGAQVPASSSTTPLPRTTRSNLADPEPGAAAPAGEAARPRPGRDTVAPARGQGVMVITPGEEPPASRRAGGGPAAERGATEGVAMPRGPNSTRTLASSGVRAGRSAEAGATPPQVHVQGEPASERLGAHPGGGRPAAPPEKAAVDPRLGERRAEIEKRAAAIDEEDLFQVLGIAQDAAPDRIRVAYFNLAKQWHPDRLPAELQDVKPLVSRVFARISEAYQTLTDAERRAQYLAGHGPGSSEDEEAKVARAVDAALEFQKAEVLVKKRDLVQAEALARRAAEADPEQPEYITLLAWILALRRGDPPAFPEGTQSPHFDDLLEKLDAVLMKEPRYERALFYRGSLLKRVGQADRAAADFRLAAEINPKNLDAVREVRLHDMRKRSAPEPPTPTGGGSIMGKIFKR